MARRRRSSQGPQLAFALCLGAGALALIVLLALFLPGKDGPVARNTKPDASPPRPAASAGTKSKPPSGAEGAPQPEMPSKDEKPPISEPQEESPPKPTQTASVTAPKPNQPAPQPKPPAPRSPQPKPQPQPEEPLADPPRPAMSPEQRKAKEAELQRVLMTVRYQLGHRNFRAAQALLKRAEAMVQELGDSPAAEQYRRVQRLAHYVQQFWLAVRESIKQLQTAEQATIDGKVVGIVEVTPQSLTLRIAGRNRTYTLQSMPTGLAFGLAEMWLDKSQGSTYLVLGAYYAVDPKNRKQRAEALWERAAQMGLAEEVQLLLPELKIPIPSTSPLAAEKNSSLARAEDGRWQLPARERLSSLLRRWKRRYQGELDQARSTPQRKQLAEKLQQVARAAPDPLERYLATWLAAEVLAPVDFIQASRLVKQLAEDFTLAAPEAQAQLAFAALRQAKEKQALGQLAPALWDLADELAVGEKLDVALRLMRSLDSALRRASLKELSEQTQQRIQELRALQ